MIITIFIDNQYTSIFDAISPRDFDVDLIHKTKSSALFSAKRKFHWHFVKANSD